MLIFTQGNKLQLKALRLNPCIYRFPMCNRIYNTPMVHRWT